MEFRNLYNKDLILKMQYLLHISRPILLFGPPCRKEEARKSNFWSVRKALSQNHQKYGNASFSVIGEKRAMDPCFGLSKG